MSGSTKAWIFLSALAATLIIIGQSVWGRQGLLWALVISLAVNALIYFMGDSRILHLFPGEEIEGQDPWRVQAAVKELTQKARIPEPRVILLASDSPQGFAVGRNLGRSTLFVTKGLIERLDYRDLKAVIAFEMATIQRQDTFVFSVGSFFAGSALAVTGLFDSAFRLVIGAKKNSHSYQSQFFTTLLAPAIALFLRFSISPKNYFSIDQLAASWLKSPNDLANALWKLDSYSKTIPMSVPESTAQFFIVTPLRQKGWTRHLIAQPSTKDRIRRLIGYYPI